MARTLKKEQIFLYLNHCLSFSHLQYELQIPTTISTLTECSVSNGFGWMMDSFEMWPREMGSMHAFLIANEFHSDCEPQVWLGYSNKPHLNSLPSPPSGWTPTSWPTIESSSPKPAAWRLRSVIGSVVFAERPYPTVKLAVILRESDSLSVPPHMKSKHAYKNGMCKTTLNTKSYIKGLSWRCRVQYTQHFFVLFSVKIYFCFTKSDWLVRVNYLWFRLLWSCGIFLFPKSNCLIYLLNRLHW